MSVRPVDEFTEDALDEVEVLPLEALAEAEKEEDEDEVPAVEALIAGEPLPVKEIDINADIESYDERKALEGLEAQLKEEEGISEELQMMEEEEA